MTVISRPKELRDSTSLPILSLISVSQLSISLSEQQQASQRREREFAIRSFSAADERLSHLAAGT